MSLGSWLSQAHSGFFIDLTTGNMWTGRSAYLMSKISHLFTVMWILQRKSYLVALMPCQVCLHVHIYMCRCQYTWVQIVSGLSPVLDTTPQELSTLVFENRPEAFQLGWAAWWVSSRDPSDTVSPRLMANHIHHFSWELGIKYRSSCWHIQHFNYWALPTAPVTILSMRAWCMHMYVSMCVCATVLTCISFG